MAFFVMVLAHAATAIAVFFGREEDHKYHDYQGFQGLALCALRFIMFFVFLAGMIKQYNFGSGSKRESRFFWILTLSGSVYFLSLPLVVLITNYIMDPLWQQEFIIIGTFFCQLVGYSTL